MRLMMLILWSALAVMVLFWKEFPDGCIKPFFTPGSGLQVLPVEAGTKEFDPDGNQDKLADGALLSFNDTCKVLKNNLTDAVFERGWLDGIHGLNLLVNRDTFFKKNC